MRPGHGHPEGYFQRMPRIWRIGAKQGFCPTRDLNPGDPFCYQIDRAFLPKPQFSWCRIACGVPIRKPFCRRLRPEQRFCVFYLTGPKERAKNGLTQTGAGKHNFHQLQVAFTAPAGRFVLRRRVVFLPGPRRVRSRFEVAYLTGFAREKQEFFSSRPAGSQQERERN